MEGVGHALKAQKESTQGDRRHGWPQGEFGPGYGGLAGLNGLDRQDGPVPDDGAGNNNNADANEDLHHGLHLSRKPDMEDIHFGMAVLAQGVAPAKHDQGAQQVLVDLIGPGGRRIEEVAGRHLQQDDDRDHEAHRRNPIAERQIHPVHKTNESLHAPPSGWGPLERPRILF